MRRLLFVVLTICLVGAIVFTRDTNPRAPRLRQSDVAALASAYIGQPEARVAKPICLLLTDRSNPVMKLNARPVWEAVVDGVDISAQFPGQPKFENKNIHRFTVLFDRQTGALLKIFSPRPKTGGLSILRARSLQDYQAITIKPTTVRPKLSLLQALTAGMPEMDFEGIMEAKEIVAYYGLVTQDPPTRIKNVPCWVVFAGGIHQSLGSGGPAPLPGTPPAERKYYGQTLYASEAFIVINANTGKFLVSQMAGGP